jgi:hypothetical protein
LDCHCHQTLLPDALRHLIGLSKIIAVDVHNVHNSQTWEKMDWGYLDVQIVSEYFHKHHLFESPCSALLKWSLEESWHRGWLGVRLDFRRTVKRIEGDLGLDSALASCYFAIAEPRREVYYLDLRVSCQRSSFSQDVGIIEESQATEVSVSITPYAKRTCVQGSTTYPLHQSMFRHQSCIHHLHHCLLPLHSKSERLKANPSCCFLKHPRIETLGCSPTRHHPRCLLCLLEIAAEVAGNSLH